MLPAPSGLQEVDGLNHPLGNLHLDQCFVPRCIWQWSHPSRCPNCNRIILLPTSAVPKLLLQMRIFGQQMVRRLAFQPLDQTAYRYLRRNGNKQVHVVLGYVSFHDLHLMLPRRCRELDPSHGLRFPPLVPLADTSLSTLNVGGSRIRCARHLGILPSLKLSRGALAEAVASRRGLQPSQAEAVICLCEPAAGCSSAKLELSSGAS